MILGATGSVNASYAFFFLKKNCFPSQMQCLSELLHCSVNYLVSSIYPPAFGNPFAFKLHAAGGPTASAAGEGNQISNLSRCTFVLLLLL